MSRMIKAIALAAILATGTAAKKPRETWQVMRSADPITGESRCAVVASDRVGRMRFTRAGAIYPVVEMNSRFGLLVGVSSGGKIRVPTGDILWRVDDRPFRELKAGDNPVAGTDTTQAPAGSVEAVTAEAMRLSTALIASSTMASGAKAREMLDEMIAGRTLIYRQAQVASPFGMPGTAEQEVGQITRKGIAPFALDESFRAGLRVCGIG